MSLWTNSILMRIQGHGGNSVCKLCLCKGNQQGENPVSKEFLFQSQGLTNSHVVLLNVSWVSPGPKAGIL